MIRYLLDILSALASVSIITGVVLVIIQIKQNATVTRANHDRQKKQATIEYISELWNKLEKHPVLNDVDSVPLRYKDIMEDAKLKGEIEHFLALFEYIAIGVETNVYDFDIVCLMEGIYLINKYKQFENFIDESRKNLHYDTMFWEYEKLVRKIKAYREVERYQKVESWNRVREP